MPLSLLILIFELRLLPLYLRKADVTQEAFVIVIVITFFCKGLWYRLFRPFHSFTVFHGYSSLDLF